MKLFYHPDQERHAPPSFLLRGRAVASPEGPVRAEMLREGLAGLGLSPISPGDADSPRLRERLARIHTPRYLAFLETIHARWSSLPDAAEMVAPNVHPCGGGHHYPRHPVGQVGWHMHDMACPMTADSFAGILASAASAEAAAEAVLGGDGSAYALCRPPGHHAGPDRAGENQGAFAVEDGGEPGLEAQRVVRSDADVATRDAHAGVAHGLFRRGEQAEVDHALEAVGLVAAVEAGHADIAHAQRKPCGAMQRRHHLPGKNVADLSEGGVMVWIHRENLRDGQRKLSPAFLPVTAKPAFLFLSPPAMVAMRA